MNYDGVYLDLIESRKNRALLRGVRYELHHIVPRSMGGSDDKSNIVALTPREHFFAHLLLKKIYNNLSMNRAVYIMARRIRTLGIFFIGSRTYQIAVDKNPTQRPFVTPWGIFHNLADFKRSNKNNQYTKYGHLKVRKWTLDNNNPYFYYVDSPPDIIPDMSQWVEPDDKQGGVKTLGTAATCMPFITPWGKFVSMVDLKRRLHLHTKFKWSTVYRWLKDNDNPYFYYENNPPAHLPDMSQWVEPQDKRKTRPTLTSFFD